MSAGKKNVHMLKYASQSNMKTSATFFFVSSSTSFLRLLANHSAMLLRTKVAAPRRYRRVLPRCRDNLTMHLRQPIRASLSKARHGGLKLPSPTQSAEHPKGPNYPSMSFREGFEGLHAVVFSKVPEVPNSSPINPSP
jgi:hypothetical protein